MNPEKQNAPTAVNQVRGASQLEHTDFITSGAGLKKFRRHGDYKFTARCPAHDDRNPGFSTSDSNGKRLALEDDSSKPNSSTNTATKRSHNCITITMPVILLALMHDQLNEGVVRDVVGQLYFGEEISPENKTALHYEGISANLIFIHNRGNKS